MILHLLEIYSYNKGVCIFFGIYLIENPHLLTYISYSTCTRVMSIIVSLIFSV